MASKNSEQDGVREAKRLRDQLLNNISECRNQLDQIEKVIRKTKQDNQPAG